MEKFAVLAARLLLAHMYIYFGATKAIDRLGGSGADPGGWVGYMQARGLPGFLLWPDIIVELGAGLLIALGLQTRLAAGVLIIFTLAANFFFHLDWSAPQVGHVNMLLFMKNMAMAGGLLMLVAHGGGLWSLDERRRRSAAVG